MKPLKNFQDDGKTVLWWQRKSRVDWKAISNFIAAHGNIIRGS